MKKYTRYSEGFKEQALAKVYSRGNEQSIQGVADDLNINLQTLKKWMKKTELGSTRTLQQKSKRPQDWRPVERLAALQKTYGLIGEFFYLYLFLDIFSRKIVGWQVYEEESSALAGDVFRDLCHREGIQSDQLILHSDNGSPMKGATMLATLQQLGVMPSLSRPAVSNDNPYSESLFKTLKYRPKYPLKPFAGVSEARDWVTGLVEWYNHEHRHSAIRFVTPAQRHEGLDEDLLDNRQAVYEAARVRNPKRWSGGVRNWRRIQEVHLNPDKAEVNTEDNNEVKIQSKIAA